MVILIAEWHRNWIRKFGSILRQLSNYPPVLLGLADEVHCFPQIVAGQVAHGEFMVQAEEMKNKVGIAEFQVCHLLLPSIQAQCNHEPQITDTCPFPT